MDKVATTWNAVRTAPSTLWVWFLLFSAVMHLVPSQAIANEVPDSVAKTPASQEVAHESVSKEALQYCSDKADLRGSKTCKGRGEKDFPLLTPLFKGGRGDREGLGERLIEQYWEPLTTDDVTSVAALKLSQVKDDTLKIPSNVESPSAPQEVAPVIASEEATLNQGDDTDDGMAQVTNVSQLGDVQPGEWAYEALRSLVERYGCIAGYPDGTFRGNRALSRYEFAAGVKACLNQIEKLIAARTDFASKEDLEKLRRLTQEFQGEIATLGTRVDKLESRVSFLEGHQFSTTTKLFGLAWFNATGAFAAGGNSIRVEASDLRFDNLALRSAGRDPITNKPIVQRVKNPSVTLSNLVWLTMETSFTGKDALVTQLAVGNGNSPANAFASAGLYNTFGVPFFDQTAGPNIGVNDVIVREAFYRFPVRNNLQVVVGPRINFYRYFDNNAFTFILTGANTFNSNGSTLSNTVDRGAGAVVLWDINKQFKLRVGYLAESDEFLPAGLFNSATKPVRGQGLFGGTNSTTAELTFSPTDKANIRLLYTRSNLQQIFGQIGGAPGEPLYGLADDSRGGPLRNATADSFVFNFDWLPFSRLGLFGRYSYGSTHLTPVNQSIRGGDVNAQSVHLGLAFPDLGKRGSLLTLSYLTPFSVLKGRNFLVAGGGNGGVQYELEATYYYPVTNNIAVVPAFYFIGKPNNFSNNPGIYVGNLRMQFSF